MFIHGQFDSDMYNYFLGLLASKLQDMDFQQLRLGINNEFVTKKSLAFCLEGTALLACTQPLKWNMDHCTRESAGQQLITAQPLCPSHLRWCQSDIMQGHSFNRISRRPILMQRANRRTRSAIRILQQQVIHAFTTIYLYILLQIFTINCLNNC